MSIVIKGTGSYLPGDPISNDKLAERFGREMLWLCETLGAKYRYFATNINDFSLTEGESNANMAFNAAKQAITDADIDPHEIDLIVMATSTPDYPFPATALFVQELLEIPTCSVIELRAGCGGMAQAFLIASQLISANQAKTALVIGSDLISPFANLFGNSNRDEKDRLVSLAMFGDGAGAAILSDDSERDGILSCFSRSMGTGKKPGMLLHVGGALAPSGYMMGSTQGKMFTHDYKAISEYGPDLIKAIYKWLVEEKKYNLADVDFFIPPQVNTRLIELVVEQMEVPPHKVFSNFEQVGNTVSASIYIALDQMSKKGLLKANNLLVLLPTEATKWIYGGIVLKWSKG